MRYEVHLFGCDNYSLVSNLDDYGLWSGLHHKLTCCIINNDGTGDCCVHFVVQEFRAGEMGKGWMDPSSVLVMFSNQMM